MCDPAPKRGGGNVNWVDSSNTVYNRSLPPDDAELRLYVMHKEWDEWPVRRPHTAPERRSLCRPVRTYETDAARHKDVTALGTHLQRL